MSEEHTHHPNYLKIWAILVVLLAISVAGPMLGIRSVTLLTAFGIAIVKAYLVAKNFMHIGNAQRYVTYIMATVLVFMLLLFSAAAPDVMKPTGANWEKPAWVADAQAAPEHTGEHH